MVARARTSQDGGVDVLYGDQREILWMVEAAQDCGRDWSSNGAAGMAQMQSYRRGVSPCSTSLPLPSNLLSPLSSRPSVPCSTSPTSVPHKFKLVISNIQFPCHLPPSPPSLDSAKWLQWDTSGSSPCTPVRRGSYDVYFGQKRTPKRMLLTLGLKNPLSV